jgi:predicted transposase YdaD
MAANHDSYYKLLFSHPELIHDLLVEFVPVVRSDTLNLNTLQRVNGSYTSEAGDARYEDMVWKVRLADSWLYVYLLLEFQSRSDEWMALRMHVYVSLLCTICSDKTSSPRKVSFRLFCRLSFTMAQNHGRPRPISRICSPAHLTGCEIFSLRNDTSL